MKREYKQAYEAPKMVRFELKSTLNVLDNFSVEATPGPDPSYDSSAWGDLDDQHWGHYGDKYPGNF